MTVSRESERERREAAFANRGDVIEGSGQAVEPRRLSEMVSVRLNGELVARLRALADEWNLTLSDVLRKAAIDMLEEDRFLRTPVVTFEVHTSLGEWSHRSGEFESGQVSTVERDVDGDLVVS